MERKRIAKIICGFLLFTAIMGVLLDYRVGLVYLGEPFIIPTVAWLVADEYCNAIDVPYQYMGSKTLDREQVSDAEWTRIFFYEQWAFVIDDREEFEEKYAPYGVDGSLVEDFDYTENILVLSFRRRIDQMYALDTEVMWQNDIPYMEPDFSYKNETESNMIYYYEVPRMEVKYEREDEVKTTDLHLSNPDYSEEKRRHINFFPFLNKWGRAFDKVNYGV